MLQISSTGYLSIFNLLLCSIFILPVHLVSQSIFILDPDVSINQPSFNTFPLNSGSEATNNTYTLEFQHSKIPFHHKTNLLKAEEDIQFISLSQAVEMLYKPLSCFNNQLPVHNAFLKIQLYKQGESLRRFDPVYKQALTLELNGSKILPEFVADTILRKIDSLTILQFQLVPDKNQQRITSNIYFWPLGSGNFPDSTSFPAKITTGKDSYIQFVPNWFENSAFTNLNKKDNQLYGFKLIENLPGTFLKIDTTILTNKSMFRYYNSRPDCKLFILKNYRSTKRYVDASSGSKRDSQLTKIYNIELKQSAAQYYSLPEFKIKTDSSLIFQIGNISLSETNPILSNNYFNQNIMQKWKFHSNDEGFDLHYGECLIKRKDELVLYYFNKDNTDKLASYLASLEDSFTIEFKHLILKSGTGSKYTSEKSFFIRIFQ